MKLAEHHLLLGGDCKAMGTGGYLFGILVVPTEGLIKGCKKRMQSFSAFNGSPRYRLFPATPKICFALRDDVGKDVS